MSTPKLPSQKSLYSKLNKRLAHYVTIVQSLYDKYNLEAAKIALNTGYEGDGEFHFDDDVVSKKLIRDVQQSFVDDMQSIIYRFCLVWINPGACKFSLLISSGFL